MKQHSRGTARGMQRGRDQHLWQHLAGGTNVVVGVRGLAQIFSRLPESLPRAQPSAMPTYQLRLGRARLQGIAGRRGSFPGDQRSPTVLSPWPLQHGRDGRQNPAVSRAELCSKAGGLIPWHGVYLFSSVAWHQLWPRSPALLWGCCRSKQRHQQAGSCVNKTCQQPGLRWGLAQTLVGAGTCFGGHWAGSTQLLARAGPCVSRDDVSP